ncbi:MAG: isochorismatase family cysteine hydrolase [Candidatus Verstraetearchaeota archaeon]|nr:isochorismatase family cysteine hydrolase [Candidatus Verstraetearchaeota archaeon]
MTTALLVIDMLNDFISGKMKCDGAADIIPQIRALAECFRKEGLPVIYICDTHYPGVDKELELWGEHAIAGTKGAEVIDELKPQEKDFVVRKRRYSGFFQTDLDLLLRELKVDRLVLTGIDTNICVRHTAADAFFRGYRIVVVRNAVASWDGAEGNEKGISYMSEIYGSESTNAEEIIESLGSEARANP